MSYDGNRSTPHDKAYTHELTAMLLWPCTRSTWRLQAITKKKKIITLHRQCGVAVDGIFHVGGPTCIKRRVMVLHGADAETAASNDRHSIVVFVAVVDTITQKRPQCRHT